MTHAINYRFKAGDKVVYHNTHNDQKTFGTIVETDEKFGAESYTADFSPRYGSDSIIHGDVLDSIHLVDPGPNPFDLELI